MRIGFRSNQAEDLGNDAPMRHENPGDGKEAARVAVVELRPEIDIEPEPLTEVVRDRDVENDAAASAVERVVDHGASDCHAEADVIARYRYGHGFGGERNERVFLALGAQVH